MHHVTEQALPGHGSGLCCRHYYCYCRLQRRMQRERWVDPRGSSALERVGNPQAAVLGDGHGGESGGYCCGCDHGRAESRQSAERTTPASSLNGSGSGTSDQARGLHTGSAVDSRMGAWAWPCLCSHLLYPTTPVCCHLMRVRYVIREKTGWERRLARYRPEEEDSTHLESWNLSNIINWKEENLDLSCRHQRAETRLTLCGCASGATWPLCVHTFR